MGAVAACGQQGELDYVKRAKNPKNTNILSEMVRTDECFTDVPLWFVIVSEERLKR